MSDLISKTPGENGQHITYCRICEALCGMIATVEDAQVTRIVSDRKNPSSQGHICIKGPAINDVTLDPDRVIYPLRRSGAPGVFTRVTWDEALEDIAKRLGDIIDVHGADAFATVYGNPPAFGMASVFAPSMFQAAVGASKTFSPQTEDTAAAMLAHQLLFGTTSWVYPDLPNCDFLLVFGSNPLVSHGSLLIAPTIRSELDAIHSRGQVVVIDPRNTPTATRYHHLPIRPDSDVWLIASMINVLICEDLTDEEFIADYCTDWPALSEQLSAITPERAANHCNIEAETIQQLARDFASHEKAAAMGRLGICRGSFPTLTNALLNILNIVAGKFHKEGGTGWGFGGSDSGEMLAAAGMSGLVPGASRTSNLPSVMGSLPSVTLLDEMTLPGPGKIRAMINQGSNSVMSMPGGSRLPEGFEQLDLMVSIDLYINETNRYADYILPATTFLERSDVPLVFLGHMLRPFAQYVNAVVEPRGEAREEYDIFKALAERMGIGESFSATPEEMVDAALKNGPAGTAVMGEKEGLSLAKLKEHPHGVMLTGGRWNFDFRERLKTEDKRIHLFDPHIADELERLNNASLPKADQLQLFSSRKRRTINSWMHNIAHLVSREAPALMMHPKDAVARDLEQGEMVSLSTRWGAVEVPIDITNDIVRGSVTYPHGWGHQGGWQTANRAGGININTITPSSSDAVEQLSGTSFLDGFEVTVQKISRKEWT